jgi:hypothetical protein
MPTTLQFVKGDKVNAYEYKQTQTEYLDGKAEKYYESVTTIS